jgi:putative AbiEi antitoxin of type IV toxin-antitoxin system/transcriptional regulator with AbiEi antitoxin domain of type IV toxin-antitoxin system
MAPSFDIACRIAATQHGHVARRQLLAAGIDRDRIKRWRADGRLSDVHHGVYAIGRPAPSRHGRWMAAVLACGEGAVLSHLAAAQLLGILPAERARPEVTVPTTNGREQPQIRVHRVAVLHALDTETHHGIAVTSPARTLLDMSLRRSLPELTRSCHEAWIRHRTTPAQVNACIARNPHKPGAGRLRLALGGDVTLSALEDGFVALLRDHGLPPARTNVDVRGDKVDCHWPQLGLTVELMSYRFHGSRRAFEADIARRRRSNHLAFTYGDVFERGPQTARELAHAIECRQRGA